jgi:hypothetical protein
MPQGVTSASLIVVILVAAAVGAVTGGLLDQIGMDRTLLAIIAGFVATSVAVVARNVLINRITGAGPDDSKIPMVVIVFILVSSLAGSLAGHEVIDDYREFYSGIWIGTIAGLLSSVIMSMLMITYYINPRPQRG